MSKLVIAEKPSVAQSLASVLGANQRKDGYFEGRGYIVSWCYGHLLGLAEAKAYDERYANWRYKDLPILPTEWKFSISKGKKAQVKVLSTLMKRSDVDAIINACDAGREGELIFGLLAHEHCHSTKQIQRLWISSMEESAIIEGFAQLKDGADYDNLYRAALCRSKADWLVGINTSRLFSVLYSIPLNVGRVQSPTLAMIAERESSISVFIREPFYIPELDLGEFSVSGEKVKDKASAENIRDLCNGKTATILSVQNQEKNISPPKLLDLTTLQRDANRLLGFTAQQTLEYTQSLYEKKLITYPRTDSRYLTSDMERCIPALVRRIAQTCPILVGKPDVTVNSSQIINNSEVSDHHAIIPTMALGTTDMNALPSGERDILNLVCVRLICAIADKHTYNEAIVTVDCEGYRFTAKGKTVLLNGWKTADSLLHSTLKTKAKEEEDSAPVLPKLSEGQTFNSVIASVKEGFTSPPKHYTEDTLLSAMETAGVEDMPDDAERKGLGTPATRAGIIERLVDTALITRKNKQLFVTDKGKNLIAILPEAVKSPLLTAEWEQQLKQVEHGELADTVFLNGIADMTKQLVTEHNTAIPEFAALFATQSSGESVGKCPRCGSEVRENNNGFFCETRDCKFALWKDNLFFTSKKKTITKSIATALLKEKRVFMSGLFSEKTGKKYDATIVLDDTGDKYVNFKLEFQHSNQKGERNHG